MCCCTAFTVSTFATSKPKNSFCGPHLVNCRYCKSCVTSCTACPGMSGLGWTIDCGSQIVNIRLVAIAGKSDFLADRVARYHMPYGAVWRTAPVLVTLRMMALVGHQGSGRTCGCQLESIGAGGTSRCGLQRNQRTGRLKRRSKTCMSG